MPTNPSPDPRSSMWAWIAHDLRLYRQRRGLSGDAVARLLNISRSSFSRLENDETRLTEAQAGVIDRAWETGGHFSHLVWYAGKGHDPSWFQQHVDIESRARVIKIWELALVPGLLQTEEYARENLLAGGNPDVEALLEARLARQTILQRADPPILWVLLWEPLLTGPTGDRRIMREQLAALLSIAELPHASIRIVPTAAGPHRGQDGSFKIMTTASPSHDVAFVEAPGGGRLVPTSAETLEYAIRWDAIGQEALPAGASRDLIARYMEDM